MQLKHEKRVNADWESCFRLCADVSRWPGLMPAVRSARVLEAGEGWDVVELEAEYGAGTLAWRSRRTLDRQKRTIHFHRLDPRPPLTFMAGHWDFEEVPGGTEVILTHEFVMADSESEAKMILSVRSNATRDLEAIATRLRTHGGAGA